MVNSFLKEKLRMINNRGRKNTSSAFLTSSRMSKRDKKNRKAGFILLFSLLISSVMLTAGLAVSRIVIRQIYLASVQRDSQMALFAADTGLECGRYWKEDGGVSEAPKCNGVNLKDYKATPAVQIAPGKISGSDDVSFFFNLGQDSTTRTCVQVDIINTEPVQRIIAKGYNVECDNGGRPSGGRVVERSLGYVYQ